MKMHMSRRLFLPAALLGGVAVFAAVFFVALAVHSVVADPGGPVPNPGHAWTEIQDHGIDGGDYWLGTIDMQALELRVNDERALRLEPNATCPNVVGGNSGNSVTAGVYGATISGGGQSEGGYINRVTDSWGTVGGGYSNVAGDDAGTISDAEFATVAGGEGNTASAIDATVGGGGGNTASQQYATVGGGGGNTASWVNATVGGGGVNAASNHAATVSGGEGNTASGVAATIAGGAQSDFEDPATGNRATDDYGTIGGGGNNQAGDNVDTTDTAPYATVGGGESNTAGWSWATVGGGLNNTASDDHATVGGGDNNAATWVNATVGGGAGNIASGHAATVSGGEDNTASGGWGATVGGGSSNEATNDNATVGGGFDNEATGWSATIPGGESNEAHGDHSFAAGIEAKANHPGAFVWADASGFPFLSTANNEFSARATGGARFVTGIDGSGIPDAGVKLDPDDNAWETLSDRDAKENFVVLNLQDVLNRLAGIPITEWNYKTQDPSNRHIGPMAQDFYAAFGLSADDLYISPIDTDGVALAAIQGLYEIVQEQDARIQALEGEAGASNGSAGLLSSAMPFGPLLLGGLFLGGLVLVQRRRVGGRS